jgi:hypothetical protein
LGKESCLHFRLVDTYGKPGSRRPYRYKFQEILAHCSQIQYQGVPETSFDCNVQEFPGIYSDMDADCQVFHMCQPNGNADSFLCPNGTMFNQQYFVCDWWYNVDCGSQDSFYGLNQFIYTENEDDEK